MNRTERTRSELHRVETKSDTNVQKLWKLFEEQRATNPSTEYHSWAEAHKQIMELLNEMIDLEAKVMDLQRYLNVMEGEDLRKD